MTEAKKIAQNAIIQTLGKGITIALALIGFGLMTRYLGQEQYGYFTTVFAFLTIFGILVDLGMQMTTTKLISDPNENESEILSNALTIRLIASVIFLGLAPLAVLFFPYPPIIKAGVAITTIAFIFSSLNSNITSHFQKHLIMHKTVIAEVASKIIYIAALLAVISYDWGLLGVVGTVVIDAIVIFIILFYFASEKIELKPRFDYAIWKKILNATWPIALTIALNLIYFKGDIFIMSLVRSQTEVGLYGAPYRMLEVLIALVYLFLGLMLPIFSAAVAIKQFEKLKRILQSTFDFLIMLCLPMIAGGYFVSVPLMVFFAGEEFYISGEILKILLLATALIFIAGLFGYVVVAMGNQKQMIKFYALNAVLSIAGYLYFIPKYSYWGAAWMTVFTEVVILLSAAYVLFNNLKFLPKLNVALKSILASAIMAGYLYLISDLNFILAIVSGALIYFAALYLLKGIDQKMILELIKTKKDETDNHQP